MLDWEYEQQGHAIARIEQECKREGVHEGDVEEIQFLSDRRARIVVGAERNSDTRGREFTEKRRDPADREKENGPAPSQQQSGRKEKCGQEDKDVWSKQDRVEEERENVHQDGNRRDEVRHAEKRTFDTPASMRVASRIIMITEPFHRFSQGDFRRCLRQP